MSTAEHGDTLETLDRQLAALEARIKEAWEQRLGVRPVGDDAAFRRKIDALEAEQRSIAARVAALPRSPDAR
jgi:hypothetical protein